MTMLERAKQFMPFAALHGFEDAIKERQILPTPRRELSDDDADRLNVTVRALKKGDMVEVVYYFNNGYTKMKGIISAIDVVMRYITVVKTKIDFDDLTEVKKI